MAGEVAAGLIAHSLALISDAAHMLTDAASIVLVLVTARLAATPAAGGYTYGLKRTEIMSAQANGITLVLLAAWLGYSAIRRLVTPPAVTGGTVLGVALAGVVVNIAATLLISRAGGGKNLAVAGAFKHILTDKSRDCAGKCWIGLPVDSAGAVCRDRQCRRCNLERGGIAGCIREQVIAIVRGEPGRIDRVAADIAAHCGRSGKVLSARGGIGQRIGPDKARDRARECGVGLPVDPTGAVCRDRQRRGSDAERRRVACGGGENIIAVVGCEARTSDGVAAHGADRAGGCGKALGPCGGIGQRIGPDKSRDCAGKCWIGLPVDSAGAVCRDRQCRRCNLERRGV